MRPSAPWAAAAVVLLVLVVVLALVAALAGRRAGGSATREVVGGRHVRLRVPGREAMVPHDVKQENLKKVCCFVGPYRSLTTLVAGVAALHPGCQVLNHGMGTLFEKDARNDFFAKGGDLSHFAQDALDLSTRMVRGSAGGSILASHAYDRKYALSNLYRGRFGAGAAMKAEPTCLMWKESQRVTRRLLDTQKAARLGLAKRFPRLVFLLVVRNPLDVVYSYITSFDVHVKLLGIAPADATRNLIMTHILEMYRGILELRDQVGPNRVFTMFEGSMQQPRVLEWFETFMGLEHDRRWVSTAKKSLKAVPSKYTHAVSLVSHYVVLLKKLFKTDYPAFYERLRAYVPPHLKAQFPK